MTLTNVVSGDVLTALTSFLTSIVQLLVNVIYSMAVTVVNFVSQPEVLGPIVAVSIILYAYKRRASKKVL